jgi:HAD superfamily hydrolase (TIGR01509 family)
VHERLDAVLFDMDGTLVHSRYDWPAIRAELGVDGASLIDALDALPAPRRERAWARMRAIETEASRSAEVADGARELLDLLAGCDVRTALVTNNSESNARALVARFGLRLDLVLTRDSGLHKPSPQPIVEAMRRLGVDASRTMAVGDSMYDVRAARAAGCRQVVIVGDGDPRLRAAADAWVRDLRELARVVQPLLDRQGSGDGDTRGRRLAAASGDER